MTKEFIGLSSEEAKKSREINGDNSLAKEKSKGFFRRFFENLNDPIIKVLIIALVIEVIVTLGNCNYIEVLGILCAILLATTVSTASEFGSEKAFNLMQKENLEGFVKVNRDGQIIEIPSSDIVVGDIVYLCAGEKIPADGIVLDGNLSVDQSALNGESKEVSKSPKSTSQLWELDNKSRVFRGSIVVSGEAVVKVMRVGAKTFYGMVARDVQTETRDSPLKIRLARLASQISKIGYIMAGIVGLTYLFNTFVADNGFIWERIVQSFKNIPFLCSSLIHALTLMITVVVVAAPEGLPMMITVVLSANMKKMMKDGVLVKKLVGIETAGSLNILFTDKTGTLTTGRLQCESFICADGIYRNISSLKRNKRLYEILLNSAFYNSDSRLSGGKIIGGNSTDRAILEFFKGEPVIKKEVSDKISFTSERKYSSVTLSDGITLIKGAPEIIIPKCNCEFSNCGGSKEFNLHEIEEEYKKAAEAGNRALAAAIKNSEGDFCFVALIILKDKIRRGVPESVRGVKKAGVHVVMVTGDGKETAASIARECGILEGKASEIVMTSKELSELSDDEVKEIIPRLSVLARALPQDKTRLVRLSQELDLVVGMTGDGINDAPSLKLSDVGFAMGNGADIAKNAGDIVLLNNSFLSINRAILYGRTIFKSIRKFIVFQLMMNITACGVSLVGQFLGIDNPITIIQMLWVNIIMDTLGGLAFAGEPPLDYYMKEKPKRRNEPILSRDMLNQIFVTGGFTLCSCIAFLKLDFFRNLIKNGGNDIYFMTAFYALFIFFGIFNCFGARCERLWILSNIKGNKPFVFIMLFISVIQIIMIYFGGSVFRTAPLPVSDVLKVILIASSAIPFEFGRRIFCKLNTHERKQGVSH